MVERLACLTLGLPHLVSRTDEESVMSQPGPVLRGLLEKAKVFRLRPSQPDTINPEAAWLGLDPEEWKISKGVLTVASLSKSPPESTVCLHVSLMSLQENGTLAQPDEITPGDLAELEPMAARLNSKKLQLVSRGATASLLWENGPNEIYCREPETLVGVPIDEALPYGEDEDVLRQFIEDSVDLLEETELNKRRRGEGLKPLNLLWPSGPGRWFQAPNLPLRRGALLRLYSSSSRLQGLAKMFGDWHVDPESFGTGLRVNWSVAQEALNRSEPAVVIFGQVASMQKWERIEEARRFLTMLEEKILKPFVDSHPSYRLTVLAPSDTWNGDARSLRVSDMGLGFNVDTRRVVQSHMPFDERVLDDKRASIYPLHEALSRAVWTGEQGAVSE